MGPSGANSVSKTGMNQLNSGEHLNCLVKLSKIKPILKMSFMSRYNVLYEVLPGHMSFILHLRIKIVFISVLYLVL